MIANMDNHGVLLGSSVGSERLVQDVVVIYS